MPGRSPENQEIVRLLSKLKEQTPDYPASLLEDRKYTFMKQVVAAQISKGGPPGRGKAGGKGGPGGTSSSLGRGSILPGLSLKMALVIGAMIVLLTAGYLFREQIVETLADNVPGNTGEPSAPPFLSTPAAPQGETPAAIGTPVQGMPSIGGSATQSAPGSGNGAPGGPSASPTPSGPSSVFQYLICILNNSRESCQ